MHREETDKVSAFGQEVSQQCVYYIIIVVGLTVERGGSSYLYWLKHIAAQNYDVVVVECVHQDWVVCIFYSGLHVVFLGIRLIELSQTTNCKFTI